MTSVVHNRPAEYLSRARQAREKATDATTEAERQELLQAAETWERMAEYEARNPTHDFGLGNGSPAKG